MRVGKLYDITGFRSLVVGIILASITAYLLFLASKNEVFSELDQVIILISGMTTIASLAAFKQFAEVSQATGYSVDDISFNEAFVSQSILEGKTDSSTTNVTIINQAHQFSVPTPLPWDLSLNQLVGSDNSLALAKLRIEIERELRRIAYENNVDIATRPLGVVSLAEELVSREVFPAIWLEVIREIIQACNAAIHGAEVSDETAASVVRTGGQLLEQLRLVSEKRTAST